MFVKEKRSTNYLQNGKLVAKKTGTATINSKGVVTAKKKGTAIITVKSGKKAVKIQVTVK